MGSDGSLNNGTGEDFKISFYSLRTLATGPPQAMLAKIYLKISTIGAWWLTLPLVVMLPVLTFVRLALAKVMTRGSR